MNILRKQDDTIVAISTAVGPGGIGIVRMSGPDALKLADQMFLPKEKKRPSDFKSFTVHYGWVRRERAGQVEIIDEALLTVMRAPKSYTREDMVEISSHGGIVALGAILKLAVGLGARLADPGEFTKRAFLNGRIDLTQAEAVLDIIQSKTEAFLRISQNQLKGELSAELESIREQLMNVYTQIEAAINFPEEDISPAGQESILIQLQTSQARVEQLLQSSEQGRILKEGIRVVLCGKPNVGKSSLMNILLKQPRAIVTPIAGTTRDSIEETVQIRGIPFQLIDTAGVFEADDVIGREAVKRSRMHIDGADLVLFVVDRGGGLSQQDEDLLGAIKSPNMIVVLNKCDLPGQLDERKLRLLFPHQKKVNVSALKKTGIDELEAAIVEQVRQGQAGDGRGVWVSNVRHIQALKNCEEALSGGGKILREGMSLEFVSEEVKEAIKALDSITGREVDNDLLEKIFSQFCIGK
ncbi:MAG: tRNA uridine-5-carboxymethylaminomethyl(34) synthesis GTPase MnmE [Candidatus Omnitrophota bacterium]